MMLIKKEVCVVYNISAYAEAFIVPNHAYTYDMSWSMNVGRSEIMKQISKDSGFDFDPSKDRMVEMWYTSDDLKSDNMGDHGFTITIGGSRLRLDYTNFRAAHYLPESALKGKQEGDILRIVFNNMEASLNNEKCLVNLTLDVGLNQLKYRYRNHGNFEEVLEKVLR